jgi:hypothetical protein
MTILAILATAMTMTMAFQPTHMPTHGSLGSLHSASLPLRACARKRVSPGILSTKAQAAEVFPRPHTPTAAPVSR